MAKNFLTDENRALFEKQLSEGDRQQALKQGAEMARADLQGEEIPDEADEMPFDALNGEDEDDRAALAEAYAQTQAENLELRDLLRRMLAMDKAERDRRALDPETEGEKAELRKSAVRKEWTARAGELRDILAFLPEMADYIMAHPEYAMDAGGLERAYDAVRSGKFRTEAELLDDADSVKRLSADPRVKSAVLAAHLAEVYRTGRAVPVFIDDEGASPAPAPGRKPGMKEAGEKLKAMLEK